MKVWRKVTSHSNVAFITFHVIRSSWRNWCLCLPENHCECHAILNNSNLGWRRTLVSLQRGVRLCTHFLETQTTHCNVSHLCLYLWNMSMQTTSKDTQDNSGQCFLHSWRSRIEDWHWKVHWIHWLIGGLCRGRNFYLEFDDYPLSLDDPNPFKYIQIHSRTVFLSILSSSLILDVCRMDHNEASCRFLIISSLFSLLVVCVCQFRLMPLCLLEIKITAKQSLEKTATWVVCLFPLNNEWHWMPWCKEKQEERNRKLT